jgi:signal transduction histidine kinase
MSVVVILLNIALILVFAAAIGIILWRVITVRRVPVNLCLFLILPVGQLFMLHSFSFDEWTVFWLFGLVLGLAADILLLIYTISQEKKTAIEEELRETRHRIELEKSHYEAVEQRREELDKIRKAFSEKLETVAEFARSGENEEARESISALAEKINRTKENPYCAIPVINAVLTEKEQNCVESGIDLSVDLNLPNTLAAMPLHLCSIFSNILDNAIAACREIRSAEKPIIRLSSIVDGDYLFIKTTNPSDKPKHKSVPGHGYGIKIVSELTKQYGGDFQSNYCDGKFTAVASLLAVDR